MQVSPKPTIVSRTFGYDPHRDRLAPERWLHLISGNS
jgi:hypothetical protein